MAGHHLAACHEQALRGAVACGDPAGPAIAPLLRLKQRGGRCSISAIIAAKAMLTECLTAECEEWRDHGFVFLSKGYDSERSEARNAFCARR